MLRVEHIRGIPYILHIKVNNMISEDWLIERKGVKK